MGLRQKVLNAVNSLLRKCSLDVASCWGRKHEISTFSDAIVTGRIAAENAFAGYLANECRDRLREEISNSLRVFEGLSATCPTEFLAGLAAKYASQSDLLIDHFMSFYARNYDKGMSQWSQDIFVMFVLQEKQRGRYLEIGGANGVTHSNTLSLRDKAGWRGVLVEPHPLQFSALKRFRGYSDEVYSFAVTVGGQESTRLLIDMGQLSALDGLGGADEHAAARGRSGKRYRVKTVYLKSFLEKIGDVDYFSLDVEGAELELVRCMIHQTSFRPLVMTIEHNFRDDRGLVKELMASAGYVDCFPSMPWLTRGDHWFVLNNCLQSLHAIR